MGVKMNWRCFLCHFGKHVDTASRLGDEETVTAFSKDLMRLYLSAPADASVTWFGTGTNALYQKYFNLPEDRYVAEKVFSNHFVLERMDAIRQRAQSAADPVYAGLQFAILGNYIDFSALYGEVSFGKGRGLGGGSGYICPTLPGHGSRKKPALPDGQRRRDRL